MLLSLAATLPLVIASALFNLLPSYLATGQPLVQIAPGQAGGVALVVLILFAGLTLLGGLWLYRYFGPRYYGQRGLIMWMLFGLALALLLKAPDWLLGERLAWLGTMWRIVSVFAAFFLARWAAGVTRIRE